MLETDLLRALQPDVTHILGLRLKPFSLGHLILLRRLENPFVSFPVGEVSYADFLEAVFICARDYETATAQLNCRWTSFRARWPHWKRKWFGLRSVKWVPLAHILAKHIQSGLTPVRVIPKSENEGGSSNVPFYFLVVSHLMHNSNQSFSEVINQPLHLSWWLYAGAAETLGAGTVVDQEELESYEDQTAKILAEFESGKRRF